MARNYRDEIRDTAEENMSSKSDDVSSEEIMNNWKTPAFFFQPPSEANRVLWTWGV